MASTPLVKSAVQRLWLLALKACKLSSIPQAILVPLSISVQSSFFAPAGATINGFICAGKFKHKINHTFEMAGAFGRTNFGRFETIVDETDDSLTIALEIVEASQDVRGVAQHQILAGDVRDGGTDEIPPEGVGSVIKLQRSANSSLLVQSPRHIYMRMERQSTSRSQVTMKRCILNCQQQE